MNRQIGGQLMDTQTIGPVGPAGISVLPSTSASPAAVLGVPAGSYTVRGGAGSVSYVMGEMVLASAGLQRVADDMAAVERTAAAALNYVESAAANAGGHPFGLIPELRGAAAGCRECRDELQKTSDDARTADSRYRDAENRAMAELDRERAVGANMAGWMLRVLGLPLAPVVAAYQLTALGLDAQNRGLREVTEEAAAHAPDYLSGLLGFPGWLPSQATSGPGRTGSLPPSGVIAATGIRHFMDSTGIFMPGDLQMRRVPPSEWVPAQQPVAGDLGPQVPASQGPAAQDAAEGSAAGIMAPTLHDVLAGSRDAYEVAPAAIVIKRVDRGDGSVAWIADLPGTEEWWPLDSANPWDAEGDMEAMTSAQRTEFTQQQIMIQEWVKTALRDAGAAPGDGVMINGHSGGGIHAAAMASDPAFLADVNVRILNIAGAPAANQNVPAGIKVLDLENTDDVVAALDLAPAPESADWVTVTSGRRPSSSLIDPGKLIANAHSLDHYLDDASELDRSQNVSVLAHKEALLQFLGPAALTGAIGYRKFVYQGTDRNRQKQEQEHAEPGRRGQQ